MKLPHGYQLDGLSKDVGSTGGGSGSRQCVGLLEHRKRTNRKHQS